MPAPTTILAIETSCDETGVAIVQRAGQQIQVTAQALASQVDMHALTGGVVPEAAAREHAAVIYPLIEKVVAESHVSGDAVDAIAVTVGPGLQPALGIGVTAARTLAYAWQKPLIPIHHIEGHIYSALLDEQDAATYNIPTAADIFPSLAVIVSGGHTLFIAVENHLTYRLLGSTRDDAAGEVFDKVARMLDLPYPGGPALAELAKQGDAVAFAFPRPMQDSRTCDVSFSGLKTAVYYVLRDMAPAEQVAQRANIAASFQQAVVDTIQIKIAFALKQRSFARLLLAGGVAANTQLRDAVAALAEQHGIPLTIAPLHLCGDNAVMIGQAAVFAHQAGRRADWRQLDAKARLPVTMPWL